MSEALDLGAVGRTLQRLVERDGRPLLLRDEATGLDHRLPAALVAASDGLMPNFLAAANVVWRAATGRHLGIEQEHDPDALLGYRVKGIRGAPFSVVMLSAMEAIERTGSPSALPVSDFAKLWQQLRPFGVTDGREANPSRPQGPTP
ncbi:hypothetical protein [Roseomonas mucosa]